jgi:hypothetical protein
VQRLVRATTLIVVYPWWASVQAQALPTKFDVATIKPSTVDNGDFAVRSLPGGTLICTGVTLRMLVMEAYEVKAFQISGGPSWVGAAGVSAASKPGWSFDFYRFAGTTRPETRLSKGSC